MIKPKELLERKRPMLTDPKEWAIIRAIHFDDAKPQGHDLDETERYERMNVKSNQRNNAR